MFSYTKVDKYRSARDKAFSIEQNKASDGFLESLDCEQIFKIFCITQYPLVLIHLRLDGSTEFANGVARLQQLLNVPHIPDDTLTNLKSISRLICQKLNTSDMQNALNSQNPKDQVGCRLLLILKNNFVRT